MVFPLYIKLIVKTGAVLYDYGILLFIFMTAFLSYYLRIFYKLTFLRRRENIVALYINSLAN